MHSAAVRRDTVAPLHLKPATDMLYLFQSVLVIVTSNEGQECPSWTRSRQGR